MARSLPTYRYRLTVEVDTPQGLRAGSSVIEVTNGMGRGPGDSGYRFGSEARGEAVAVDLPDGQTLFALLRSEGWLNADWAGRIVYDLTPVPPIKEGEDHRIERLANAVSNRALIVVPPSKVVVSERVPLYPQLVTFADIGDPKTVTRVDPDNLAASFGPGVKLRRITVQITEDPVTTGIEKRLGWLPRVTGALQSIDVADYPAAGVPLPLAANLTEADFKRGVPQ